MAEQQNQSVETAKEDTDGLEKKPSGTDASADASPSKFKKMLSAVNSFLDSLNEAEPEPPPPPERSMKESIQDFFERCRDREKCRVMLKEFGGLLCRGMMFLLLLALMAWGTVWALDFNDNHHVKFYPPNEVVDYLAAEHEALETTAYRMMPLTGKDDNIPFSSFDAKLIEMVRPIRIHSDEYGIYFMTSKDWYNGEHGIFIAKEEENMPPDLNWGLIEGRIYAYAICD